MRGRLSDLGFAWRQGGNFQALVFKTSNPQLGERQASYFQPLALAYCHRDTESVETGATLSMSNHETSFLTRQPQGTVWY